MIITVTLNPSLDEWVDLPRLRIGALNRADGFARYPGGKGINVSRVVHELQGNTLALAVAGGADGKILSHLLSARHIRHRFVAVPGLTRNNYQIRSRSPHALTQINCPGPRVSSRELEEIGRILRALRRSAECVVLSGSLPPGAPPDTYARFIRRLRQLGVPAALDASGPALGRGVAAQPWLIKPNLSELQELVAVRLRGLPAIANAARRLTQRGVEVVLISLGGAGAVLAARNTPAVWFAKPPAVRVHSTVGAGDSTVAGFVTGWLGTRSLVDAFRLGMACGAASVMTSGTELAHRRDVQRLMRRVVIRAL